MKKMIKYLNKKQLVLLVMSLIVIVSSFSYAFYMYSESQEGSNLASSACFKLTLEDKNDISLTDVVPLTEEEGNELVPYEFTIKNVCKIAANYQVNIETKNNSTLETLYLRSKINDDDSVILGSLEEVDEYINDDIKESRKIDTGLLLENEEVTYRLRLWIDNDSTVEQSADKIWKGKVVVTGLMNKNPYSHKIRLHANGGYLSYNEIERIPERIIGNIEEPIYDGYSFVGWYSDEELTQGISLEEEKAGNVNDLYAKYIAKTYKLSILPNQGEYKGSTSTYEENVQYGELYTLENTTRYGYTFNGWEVVNGEETTVDGNILTMGKEDSTVKAQWTINKHKLTIEDTYTCDVSNVELEYQEEYILCEPEREGYTFTGWDNITQINGTKFTMDDSDVTIRAQWEKNDYGYIVNHYQMTTDGSTYTLKESNTYEGKYEETKEGERKTYEGFTTPEAQTITIGIENNKIDYYYERNKYELTIDCNGGNECPEVQEYYYEEEVELPTINRIGYNFAGWDKTTTNNKYKMPASDTTISALWSAISYTITFNPNGGDALSTTEQTKSVTYDSTYGTLPSPTRIGYSFNGWYIDDTKIESTTVVKITENKIARAHWNANTYNIEFEPNGGTLDTTSKEVVFDEIFGELPVPVKEGYTFLGWFSDSALTQGITEQTVLQSEITKLYAKYTEGTYELTINANNGNYTGTPSVQVTYGQTYILGNITREGYTFTGWEVVSGKGTTVTNNVVTMGVENSTVKATWTINTYTLTVDCDGGTGCLATGTYNYNQAVTLTAPTRTGYTFNGWTKVSGAGSLTSNNVYTMGDGIATIKATWTANNYGTKVTHNQQNVAKTAYTIVSADTVVENKAYGSTWTPAVKSYTGFTSPSTQTKTITTETNNASPVNNVINYNYNRNSYTLTIAPNGGTCNSSTSNQTASVAYQGTYSLPSCTKTGYSLSWKITSGSATLSGSTVTMAAGASTATAQWSANSYTVTFNVNGGNALSTSDQTKSVTYASTYGTLPTPTRTGYTFNGWYTASSGGTQKTSSTTVSITASETLYAHWTINKYTITYNANGGSVSPASDEVNHGSTLSLPTPTRSSTAQYSYTFAGWYTACSGGTQVTNSTQWTSSQTICAHWTSTTRSYTITVNNGTGSGTYAYGTNVTITGTVPSNSSTGWNNTAACTSSNVGATRSYNTTGYSWKQWSDGNTTQSRTITVTGNATYTAQFNSGTSTTTQTCRQTGGSYTAAYYSNPSYIKYKRSYYWAHNCPSSGCGWADYVELTRSQGESLSCSTTGVQWSVSFSGTTFKIMSCGKSSATDITKVRYKDFSSDGAIISKTCNNGSTEPYELGNGGTGYIEITLGQVYHAASDTRTYGWG